MTTADESTRTMRAVVQDGYGGADVLRMSERLRPETDDRQVLVRVHAAGLDRGTEHLLTGKPYAVRLAMGLRRPRNPIPGRDVAGVVERVGSAVTEFSVGDQVYGVAPGSFAEYVGASPAKLSRKPANLSFAQAAVVPISGGTALQAVRDVGHLLPGQKVLVIGASGGVGSYAVQLAKLFGAEVSGVAGPGKQDFVAGLGADRVLDHTSQDFADGSEQYDLILDIGGNPSLARLRRALSPEGTVVFVGGENAGQLTGMGRPLRGMALSPFVRHRLRMFYAKERASDLEELTPLLESGKITPALDRTYPLDEAAEAMRLLAAGQVRGKVAITV